MATAAQIAMKPTPAMRRVVLDQVADKILFEQVEAEDVARERIAEAEASKVRRASLQADLERDFPLYLAAIAKAENGAATMAQGFAEAKLIAARLARTSALLGRPMGQAALPPTVVRWGQYVVQHLAAISGSPLHFGTMNLRWSGRRTPDWVAAEKQTLRTPLLEPETEES